MGPLIVANYFLLVSVPVPQYIQYVIYQYNDKEFCFFFKTIANGYSIITRGKCVSIIQMTEFQVINYFPDKLN